MQIDLTEEERRFLVKEIAGLLSRLRVEKLDVKNPQLTLLLTGLWMKLKGSEREVMTISSEEEE